MRTDRVGIHKPGVGADELEFAPLQLLKAGVGEFRDDFLLPRVDGLHVGARRGDFQAEGLSLLGEMQHLGHVEPGSVFDGYAAARGDAESAEFVA